MWRGARHGSGETASRRGGELRLHDLTTWKRDVACLTGVRHGGVVPL